MKAPGLPRSRAGADLARKESRVVYRRRRSRAADNARDTVQCRAMVWLRRKFRLTACATTGG
jgi:hypothetical protein